MINRKKWQKRQNPKLKEDIDIQPRVIISHHVCGYCSRRFQACSLCSCFLTEMNRSPESNLCRQCYTSLGSSSKKEKELVNMVKTYWQDKQTLERENQELTEKLHVTRKKLNRARR